MRDCRMEKLDEAEELKEYTQHMKWFDECSSGSFVDWYKNKEDLVDDEKKVGNSVLLLGLCCTNKRLYADLPVLLVKEDLICHSVHYFRHKRAPEYCSVVFYYCERQV